jgi:putative transposase
MGRNRRDFTVEFKSKVASEALKGDRTLAELSSVFEVHSSQIREWKLQAVEALKEAFSRKRGRKPKNESGPDDLLKMIGRLQVENEFLKKKYEQLLKI